MKPKLLLYILTYFLFVLFYIFLFRDCMIDDTYITLCYVKNLSYHFQWGMIKDLPSNSATSPLNVILLSTINFFLNNPEISVLVLSVLLHYLSFFVLLSIGRFFKFRTIFPFFTSLLILVNPLIISTLGLESLLIIVLYLLLLLFYIKDKVLGFGVILGLLYLARPDAVLLAVPFVIIYKGIKKKIALLCIALILVLPWLLFSWQYFGSIFPDTLIIKKIQKSWGEYGYGSGWLLYFNKFPLESVTTIFPVLYLLVISLNKSAYKSVIGLVVLLIFSSGVLYYVSYWKLEVPPYHWYYVPTLTCLIIASSFLLFNNRFTVKKESMIAFVLLFLCSLSSSYLYKNTYGFSEMPIHTNWANKNDYKKLASIIDDKLASSTYVNFGVEIGTIAYFSEKAIYLDQFSWRKEIIDLYSLIYSNFEGSHSLVKLLLRTNLYHIHSVKENYPEISNARVNITAYPETNKEYELLGQYSSRWNNGWKIFIEK